METIFYYTGWVFLILLTGLLIILLIMTNLYLINKIISKIKVYWTLYLKFAIMNSNERKISDDLYKSVVKWEKEKINQ